MTELEEPRSVSRAPVLIGRYALFDEIAAGGAATVHLGRLLGPRGRTVAIKSLHPHYLKDHEFVAMFMDEARIVSRIPSHPNVVPMIDLMRTDGGLFLVIEYIHGESLAKMVAAARAAQAPIPPKIAGAILAGVLHGLHAAHETRSRDGQLLDIVHRDVSPANIIVGADGVPRVVDFGIAKAAGRAQTTREGQIKGKLAYMAPEQIRGQVDRRADVFAAAVVLWELLAGRRMHGAVKDVDIITRVLRGKIEPPSAFARELSADVDALVLKGIAVDPSRRHGSAREFALGVEKSVGVASAAEVAAWVERFASGVLAERAVLVGAMEKAATGLVAAEFVVAEETVRQAPSVSSTRSAEARTAEQEAEEAVEKELQHVRASSQVRAAAPVAVPEPVPERAPALPSARSRAVVPPPSVAARARAPVPLAKDGRLLGAVLVGLVALAIAGGVLGAVSLSRRPNAETTPTSADPPATAAATTAAVEHPVAPPRAAPPQ